MATTTNTDSTRAARDTPEATRTPGTTERPSDASSLDRLRLVVRANAGFSMICGLAMVALPGAIDDLLGTGQQGWVRLVGAGLVAFAVGLLLLASRSRDLLLRLTPWVCAADVMWVVGSVVTILLGWYSTGGVIAVVAVAAVVDTFAVLQFRAWRTTTR